jgi:hypothetical protein
MGVMVNTVVLSTDRAWTRFEIDPGPQRIKNSPPNAKRAGDAASANGQNAQPKSVTKKTTNPVVQRMVRDLVVGIRA